MSEALCMKSIPYQTSVIAGDGSGFEFILELDKVCLQADLEQDLAQQVTIGKVTFKVSDDARQLQLVIDP